MSDVKPMPIIKEYYKMMEELKLRLEFVGKYMGENVYHGHDITIPHFENSCLQIRKLLEMIAMGTLVVNQEYFDKANRKFLNAWNMTDIIKDVKKLNPNYFPIPFDPELTKKGRKIVQITDNVLTEDLLKDIYVKCSHVLHTHNPYRAQVDYVLYYYDIMNWADLILRTMRDHITFFPDVKGAVIIHLNKVNEEITCEFAVNHAAIFEHPSDHTST